MNEPFFFKKIRIEKQQPGLFFAYKYHSYVVDFLNVTSLKRQSSPIISHEGTQEV
jgi:hypothetical protein